MAGAILTPKSIWQNFTVDKNFTVECLSQRKSGETVTTRLFLSGRKVDDGFVKIYCELVRNINLENCPALLLLQDLGAPNDKRLVNDLVKKGYAVLTVDLEGYSENKEFFTAYPLSLEYANYQNVKENLYSVKEDVTKTCWYEWVGCVRYALAYLKSMPFVTKIGGFAIGESATTLWQVAGTDKILDAVVFAFNAGWTGYRGIQKFALNTQSPSGDELYKFIAGIDAQSYAMHVACPTLLLCATNHPVYDVDRSADTLAFINPKHYSALHYSVGSTDAICGEGYVNAILFLDKFLCDNKEKLPTPIEISGAIKEGVFNATVSVDTIGLKSVNIFVAEQQENPKMRSWQKLDFVRVKDNKYEFDYLPFNTAKIITAFAMATYANGFSVCSKIIAQRFNEKQVNHVYKSNVIYSSREKYAESTFFSPCEVQSLSKIALTDKSTVVIKKGPMAIYGITGKCGLTTFKVSNEKFKLNEDAMLMMDVYVKEACELNVSFICDYFGESTEYVARVKLNGGEVWHNVQLEINKFKTAEGMALKSYERIDALHINTSNGEFVLNNLLWV